MTAKSISAKALAAKNSDLQNNLASRTDAVLRRENSTSYLLAEVASLTADATAKLGNPFGQKSFSEFNR